MNKPRKPMSETGFWSIVLGGWYLALVIAFLSTSTFPIQAKIIAGTVLFVPGILMLLRKKLGLILLTLLAGAKVLQSCFLLSLFLLAGLIPGTSFTVLGEKNNWLGFFLYFIPISAAWALLFFFLLRRFLFWQQGARGGGYP